MKISEVMKKLSELLLEEGDLDVYLPSNLTIQDSVPMEVYFVEKLESSRSTYVMIS